MNGAIIAPAGGWPGGQRRHERSRSGRRWLPRTTHLLSALIHDGSIELALITAFRLAE